MQRPDGGPAFPLTERLAGLSHPVTHDGMTLRDYFAASALNGLLACPEDYKPPTTHSARARFAYDSADAMLAERGK